MARKKSLSDVVREETQQPLNPDVWDSGASDGENTPLVPLQLPKNEATSSTPTIDLSDTVEDLKKSLAASQEKEKKLQTQLKEAQTKLKEQTDLNHSLSADRGKIEQLTKELSEAKATILQLTTVPKEQPVSAIKPSWPRYPVQSNEVVKRRSKTDVGWMD
jgi:predicted RNase H-like nuclease (RuvC/YqgF family)